MKKGYPGIFWLCIVILLLLTGCTTETGTTTPDPLTVTSTSFSAGGYIDEIYCNNENGHTGSNISPQLSWSGAPSETVEYALIMDDPYAVGQYYSHWILYNIPDTTIDIAENFDNDVGICREGTISSGATSYEGPYPPSGIHNYYFRIYALDTIIDLTPAAATRSGILSAMDGHIIGYGDIFGTHDGH